MKSNVFVRQRGGSTVPWRRTTIREIWRRGLPTTVATGNELTIGGEEYLENLIVEHPELLGLENDDEDSPIHGPFKCFPQRSVEALNSRSIYPDILILAESGDVIVVEVKLGDNQELKDRRVVGQVLEYAASLSACGEAELFTMFDGATSGVRSWPELVRLLFPGARDAVRLANQFASRFRAADLHLVIACDDIPPGLPELVKGVVDQKALGGFQFRVVEIAPYSNESGNELLFLPATRLRTEIVQRIAVHVIGDREQPSVSVAVTSLEEAETRTRSVQARAAGKTWDEESFFAQATELVDVTYVRDLRRFYDNAVSRCTIRWGSGAKEGGFTLLFPNGGGEAWSIDAHCRAWVRFSAYPESTKRVVRDALRALPGVSFTDTSWPSIKPEMWLPHADAILDLLDRLPRAEA